MADIGIRLEDGEYAMDELANVVDSDFKKEKDLCKFIETHIHEFCKDALMVDYESHCREFPLYLTKRRVFGGNRRLDLLINAKDGTKIAIECKVPLYPSELSYALGQIMTYITLFEKRGIKVDRYILLSGVIDPTVPLVITKFNLPIEYIVIDKSKFLKFIRLDGTPNR